MRRFKFIIFKSVADGQWYWQLRASNGKIVAASEGYRGYKSALKTCESIRSHATRIEVRAAKP